MSDVSAMHTNSTENACNNYHTYTSEFQVANTVHFRLPTDEMWPNSKLLDTSVWMMTVC